MRANRTVQERFDPHHSQAKIKSVKNGPDDDALVTFSSPDWTQQLKCDQRRNRNAKIARAQNEVVSPRQLK